MSLSEFVSSVQNMKDITTAVNSLCEILASEIEGVIDPK